jgi:hypothetical protein
MRSRAIRDETRTTMTLPETHWLAEHDLTTPANHRPTGAGRTAPGTAATTAATDQRRELTGPATALVFLAAVWLVVAAIPVAYHGTGRFDVFWSDVVIGLALATVTLIRLSRPAAPSPLVGITLALGAWLMAAPFVLGYGGGSHDVRALWNDLALGFAVLVLTLFSRVSAPARTPTGRPDER